MPKKEDAPYIVFGESGPLLKNVPIFRVGNYSHKGKGDWTAPKLQAVVDNFQTLKAANELIPPIKSSHTSDNRGLPVMGWIENVRKKGSELMADFRLVSEKVKKLIKKKAFRFRSVELHSDKKPWMRPDGSKMANVLRGVAFVPLPECKGLPDIEFQVAAFGGSEDEYVSVNFQEDIPMTLWRHKESGDTSTEDKAGQDGWIKFEEKDETPPAEGDKADGKDDKDGKAGDPPASDGKADDAKDDGAGSGDAAADGAGDGAGDGKGDDSGSGDDGAGDAGAGDQGAKDGAGDAENHDDQASVQATLDNARDLLSKGKLAEAKTILAQFSDKPEGDEGTDDFAELTADDRKALKADQFAGPNRSFPVPDCTHYSNALARVFAFRGSFDDQQKIRRNIVRMGLKLGCGTAEDRADELNIRRGTKLEEFGDDVATEGLWFGDGLERCKDGVCTIQDVGCSTDPVKEPEPEAKPANFADVTIPAGSLDFDEARKSVEDMDLEALKDQEAKNRVEIFGTYQKTSDIWVENEIKEGRMIPAQRDDAQFLSGAAASRGKFEFDDGKVESYADRFRRFVESGGKVMDFGEHGTQDGADAGSGKASETMSDEEVKAEVERIKKGEAPK